MNGGLKHISDVILETILDAEHFNGSITSTTKRKLEQLHADIDSGKIDAEISIVYHVEYTVDGGQMWWEGPRDFHAEDREEGLKKLDAIRAVSPKNTWRLAKISTIKEVIRK